MDTYVELTYWEVAFAAMLIVSNAVISIVLQLRIERLLILASFRTIIQLLLVGMVLESVFRLERWYVVVGLGLMMTLIAGVTAAQRNQRHYPGIWLNSIISVWASAWIITSFALFVVLQGIDRWYAPQYSIPLLGMVLGNTLNGISLALGTMTESLVRRREQVESLLALGATRWEAARNPVQDAVRTGMIPVINSMMIVGVVSLPGMMTGQLISGMNPMEAVKYQVVIMFLIASATSIGTLSIVLLTFLRLLNPQHQFRRDLITDKPGV